MLEKSSHRCPSLVALHLPGGGFGYIFFNFFFSGAGEREEASEEVAGGPILIENRGRGVGSEEEAREGERAPWRCLRGGWGGGLNIYFRGRNAHRVWEAAGLGNCLKSESSRKWLGEGAKGLLDPASKRPLALVRNGVAPVQKRVWVVQTTLWRPLLPGPKRVRKTFCTLP